MVTSRALYLGLLAALVAERLAELWLSRRNAARAVARGGVETGRADFRVMAAVHALFPLACAAEVLAAGRTFLPAVGWPALAVAAGAQGLRWWAIAALGDRWNVRIVTVPGDPPVVRGPYRWLRHPNYLAVIAELAALPLVHGAWVTAAVFSAANAGLLARRIPAEERALGAPWARAFAGRPRLVPSPPAAAGTGPGPGARRG
jgi:methyltransferase